LTGLYIVVFLKSKVRLMKIRYLFWLCLLSATVIGQNNKSWRGYFSYNNVVHLAESDTKIYASAENAYFTKDLLSGELKTTNTVDGLSGQNIEAFYHCKNYPFTFLGFSDGIINFINENAREVRSINDIRNNQGIAPNLKKINHFYEHQNLLYISCGFGIVVFNLETLKFGDTYFIGAGGAEVNVLNTTVLDNMIYATIQNNGIRRANLSNSNLINFTSWVLFEGSTWKKTLTFGNEIIGVTFDNQLYKIQNSSLSLIQNMNEEIINLQATEDYLLAVSSNRVSIFNSDFMQQFNFQNNLIFPTANFNCATVQNNILYVGTASRGVLQTNLNNLNASTFFKPDGPLENRVFKIKVTPENVWSVYGYFTNNYNPFPLNLYGISTLSSNSWEHIAAQDVLGAVDLCHININPRNPSEVFVSSYHSGLLRILDRQVTTLFNSTNSSLESLSSGNSIRIGQSAFDNQGNLWVTNSRIANGLKKKKTDGEWSSFNLGNAILNPDSDDILDLVIDKNGVKWIGTNRNGLIGFQDNGNIIRKLTSGTDAGALPSASVSSIAIDNRNQLWIGTRQGLRILPSVDRFQGNQSLGANAIIILEDDLAQELLFQQSISKIKVDGANNKWIGTTDAGVFLVSSNGQQTLQRFTSTNSPLPSNSITDIDINPSTGEVFFATDRGLVSYKASATEGNDNLNEVFVYPNPVRPGYTGTVKISGLMDRVNLKITDIEGNLVFETTSQGGTVEWDTTAFGKYKVASGIYMVFVVSNDGVETKVKKIMIVR
jgi:hypothetical protein